MAATPVSSLLGGPARDGWLLGAHWLAVDVSDRRYSGLRARDSVSRSARRHAREGPVLTPPEQHALLSALAGDKHDKPKKDLWAAMKDTRVLMLTAITFAFTIGSYGIGIWLPLILKGHGLSNMDVGWLSAVPYLFATAGMLLWARLVDRKGRKIYNLMAALILGALGLTLSVVITSLVPALACLTLALVGTISARTVFYTIPQSFLTGTAAAGGIAFINSVGAFGGFVGPYMAGFLKDTTGSFNAGMIAMAVILVVATGIAGTLKLVAGKI
jgi:nitrate/nitrite transporter NarK